MTGAPRFVPPRGRLSADSKLLAAGGALAAAMLLVATGVLLGQRSAANAAAGTATGPYPVVVETKAPAAAAALPAAATVEARPVVTAATIEKADGPMTIDVQQLPSAPRPRPQGWSVVTAAPRGGGPAGAAGWTVAGSPLVHPVTTVAAAAADPAATPQAAAAAEPAEPVATAATVVPEPSAAPPVVDPLVQAVREDIREDESRTK